jgi:hypothetical protein
MSEGSVVRRSRQESGRSQDGEPGGWSLIFWRGRSADLLEKLCGCCWIPDEILSLIPYRKFWIDGGFLEQCGSTRWRYVAAPKLYYEECYGQRMKTATLHGSAIYFFTNLLVSQTLDKSQRRWSGTRNTDKLQADLWDTRKLINDECMNCWTYLSILRINICFQVWMCSDSRKRVDLIYLMRALLSFSHRNIWWRGALHIVVTDKTVIRDKLTHKCFSCHIMYGYYFAGTYNAYSQLLMQLGLRIR